MKKRGYKILEKNFITPFGEIDIVAKKDRKTVFVEVKTLGSDRYDSPFCQITKDKKRTVIKNAFYYIKKNALTSSPTGIDIIGVVLDKRRKLKRLDHLENAFDDIDL